MVDKLFEIKEIIVVLITFLGFILLLISKVAKNSKIRKIAENLFKLEDSIIKYMFESENFYSFTGDQKREWVKTKINQYCIDNKVAYDDQNTTNTIEKMIQVSKQINKREKDMEVL